MARMPDAHFDEVRPGQHHGKLGWWKEHKQRYLDGHVRDEDDEWQRVEATVLPFLSRITIRVELEEETVWRVGY